LNSDLIAANDIAAGLAVILEPGVAMLENTAYSKTLLLLHIHDRNEPFLDCLPHVHKW
jgi:hypothetical protein